MFGGAMKPSLDNSTGSGSLQSTAAKLFPGKEAASSLVY
jgi:hypothetical protein